MSWGVTRRGSPLCAHLTGSPPPKLSLTLPMMLLMLMMEPGQPLDTRAWAAA